MHLTLEFRKMKLKDVYQFRHWGVHQDLRFYQYNFNEHDTADLYTWFRVKQRLLFRKVYGLFLEEYPLGFVTLKHIRLLKGTAELGIAVDPNYLSEGFGTELLKRFLTYVFTHFPIRTMTLRVAHFNERAKKSYEKVGFVKVSEKSEPYEEQRFKEVLLTQYPELFTEKDGLLYTTFIKMAIEKEAFLKE